MSQSPQVELDSLRSQLAESNKAHQVRMQQITADYNAALHNVSQVQKNAAVQNKQLTQCRRERDLAQAEVKRLMLLLQEQTAHTHFSALVKQPSVASVNQVFDASGAAAAEANTADQELFAQQQHNEDVFTSPAHPMRPEPQGFDTARVDTVHEAAVLNARKHRSDMNTDKMTDTEAAGSMLPSEHSASNLQSESQADNESTSCGEQGAAKGEQGHASDCPQDALGSRAVQAMSKQDLDAALLPLTSRLWHHWKSPYFRGELPPGVEKAESILAELNAMKSQDAEHAAVADVGASSPKTPEARAQARAQAGSPRSTTSPHRFADPVITTGLGRTAHFAPAASTGKPGHRRKTAVSGRTAICGKGTGTSRTTSKSAGQTAGNKAGKPIGSASRKWK